nr:unnamed protein product [Digitaria exilis]
MPKRRRSERDVRRRSTKHLSLIFDDWPWGYSMREIDLLSPSAVDRRRRRRRLPRPIIHVKAPRGSPCLFAGVGTRIIATHTRNDPGFGDWTLDGFLPIVDVRSRGVVFGPGGVFLHLPIFFPVGDDELYALFENCHHHAGKEWAWRYLTAPPFDRMDVVSYALHPDGTTILVSAAEPFIAFDGDGAAAAAAGTFAFDTTGQQVWTRHAEWTMPFAGRAHFVHSLNAFVGLSDDPDTLGHLCSCDGAAIAAGGGGRPEWKVGKEKLFSEDPCERHHVSNGDEEQLGEEDGVVPRRPVGNRYRVTTFSLGYDGNGNLTTGETCQVRCYKVPQEIRAMESYDSDPAAFWL